VVAVSGGLDSVALLALLAHQAARYRWRLAVAHFNHCLRGKASDSDARWVKTLAAHHALPFYGGAGEVAKLAREHGWSTEMAARDLRHRFLARTARQFRARHIVLAHHADDQAEQFFLRLLRGTGVESLGGMAPLRPSPVDPAKLLVRPLLDVTKAELTAVAKEAGLSYREDRTNEDTTILRNRVRQELLPHLVAEYQPALVAHLGELMDQLRAQGDCLGEQARQWIDAPRIPFDQMPVAIQRQVLVQQLRHLNVPYDFALVERLRQTPGKPVSIGTRFAHQAGGRLRLLPPSANDEPSLPCLVNLTPSGQASYGRLTLRWRVSRLRRAPRLPPPHVPGEERFDADKTGPAVVLRHWQPGDAYQACGAPGISKLQDIFVNQKVPKDERHRKVIVTTVDGEIIWVEGLRISERFKLDKSTRRQLKWCWLCA
jgi:tRNA(Ile)-lysidine synthase